MQTQGIFEQLIWAASAGILAQVIAHLCRQPSIAFLLLTGFLLGPHAFGVLNPSSYRNVLPFLAEAAVVVILFDGSLTLRREHIRRLSATIRTLITTGWLFNAGFSTLAAKTLTDASWGICLMFGSLVSITGPTVIGPIVKRVRLKRNLAATMLWESILLDPIGAIAAVICLEVITDRTPVTILSLIHFPGRLAIGFLCGLIIGIAATLILRVRNLLDLGLLRALVLALALFCYGVSEHILPHSGLMAIVTLGIILGNSRIRDLDKIIEFKESLTLFLLSVVFVILSANLNPASIIALGWRAVVLVVFIMLVIRPASVWLSTRNSPLRKREKFYLAWVSPRGIVAASLASLASLQLKETGYPGAQLIESLVYLVIVTTIIFQGLSAGLMARILKVSEPRAGGWLIVGANSFATALARFLKEKGLEVILVDSNLYQVAQAQSRGLDAHHDDILAEDLFQKIDLSRIGNILALTSNDEINTQACQTFSRLFGAEHAYRPRESVSLGKTQSLTPSGIAVFPGLPSIGEIIEGFAHKTLELKLSDQPRWENLRRSGGEAWPVFLERGDQLSPVATDKDLRPDDRILYVARVPKPEA